MNIRDLIAGRVSKQRETEGNLCLKDGTIHIQKDPRFSYVSGRRAFPACEIESPVRDAVCDLNAKNIYTHYSEGGGSGHSVPDYAYVVARLAPENVRIAERYGFLLDEIYVNGTPVTFAYPGTRKTGYYVIGFNRESMKDKAVSKRFNSLVKMLKTQENDLAGRQEGIRKEEKPEIDQLLLTLGKI